MPAPSAVNTAKVDIGVAMSAQPMAAPMNGAEQGDATTTASTPDSASLTYALRALQPEIADGSSWPISNTPERVNARTKNSAAKPTTTIGDCSWKPQPRCWPAART